MNALVSSGILNSAEDFVPDPDTALDVAAMTVLGTHGFVYSGSLPDLSEIYCRRFTSRHVDLMSLSFGEKPSGVCRYEQCDFPWPRGDAPEPEIVVTGSLLDVVREVLEWPV
ncbi:hypothetical protein [Amycolatopsis taiwanensis]|uniref:hypothetical protein n=1 Tax=Amycolatopsis taiwanensis TaxID=342230 RepID=UPI00047F86F2|nr:hypothetical protein [Amycolatopsis taiwanensis]